MIKNLAVAILLCIFGLTLSSPTHAQDKSLVWERMDVDITVNVDGTFDVAEHQTIRFTRGTFTQGSRDIPVRNFGRLDNWSLTAGDGTVYTPATSGEQPYTFSVEESRYQYVIRWFFPTMQDSSETYTIRYRVHDGLRFYEAGDQLWWKAIFKNRPFPVLAGQVRVHAPEGTSIQQWAGYINNQNARDDANAELLQDERTIVFNLVRTLSSGEEFEVRVEFDHGVVDGEPQGWQIVADAEAAEREAELAFYRRWQPIAAVGFGALGILLMLGGPAALYGLWYQWGRDKPVELVADYLPEPPDDLSPGMAGTLLDETVDMEDIMATLVDLARRKAISITEDKNEGFFSSSTDFIYRREREDIPLAPYEAELIHSLFGSQDEVRLSALKNKFYDKLPRIKKRLYTDVTEADLFPRSPETVRSQYGCLGAAGIVGGVIVGVVLMMGFGYLTGAAVLPGIGMGITAIGMVILSRHMPRKTDNGSERAARWRAFKSYLQDIDKYADLEQQKPIWDRWLPYAIAFGIDKEYIRKFERVQAPAPGWYIPSPTLYGPYRRRYYGTPGMGGPVYSGGGVNLPNLPGGSSEEGGGLGGDLSDMSRDFGRGLSDMSRGLGTMLTGASAAMTSRPSSTRSSSGSGWSSSGGGFSGGGWSGGGGFSGGGSFGGGGGGGGGGGFS